MKKISSIPNGGSVYRDNSGYLLAMISIAGKKHWKRVSSAQDAIIWAEGLRSQFTGSLTKAQLAEAIQAFAMLPKGVSLIQALQSGLDRINSPETNVADAIRDYLAEKQASQAVSDRTLSEYATELKKFSAAFPVDIQDVSHAALTRFVCGCGSPVRQMHMRVAVSAFFSWCRERELVKANPAEGIKTAKLQKSDKEVLTPAQAKALLKALLRNVVEAKDSTAKNRARRMIAYSAICMFGGLRPMEAFRLSAADIHEGHIFVSGEIAKSHGHKERVVPINETLKAWLAAYPFTGRITPFATISGVQQYMAEVKAAAGIKGNTQDILRHSAGSYLLHIEGDSAKVALWLGHSQDVANTHYRNKRVTLKEAKEYFALTPKAVQGSR